MKGPRSLIRTTGAEFPSFVEFEPLIGQGVAAVPREQRRGRLWAMIILQAMTGDDGLSGSLAEQE
jgi:hypothetical protein